MGIRSRLAGTLLCALLVVTGGDSAGASPDWPLDWRLPCSDISVGLAVNAHTDESLSDFSTGAGASASFAFYDGFLGARATFGTRREGLAMHLGGALEFTFWYGVLMGPGVSYWHALAAPGREVPAEAWGLNTFFALPVPITQLTDGKGTLVLLPFFRPGVRFPRAGNAQGHWEVGVSLEWTSFTF